MKTTTRLDAISPRLKYAARFIAAVAVIIFFGPLVILPFFNHAAADDYVCAIHLKTEGFWTYQRFIYHNWGGRFAATFTGSLFVLNQFLYNHYYLHSLLLLVLDVLSAGYLIYTLNRYLFRHEHFGGYGPFIVLLLVALQHCSMIELSTYTFWFSSAITYHLPLVLIQFQVGLWLLFFYGKNNAARQFSYCFLPLLIFVINGFNELFIVVQAVLLLLVFLAGLAKRSKMLAFLTVAAYAAGALMVLLSPGIGSRFAMIAPKGLFTGLVVIFYQLTGITWSIGKNPLFWLAISFAFVYGNHKADAVQQSRLLMIFRHNRWLLPGVICGFVLLSLLVAVVGLNGGNIPGRYINGVIGITLSLMLLLAFTEGTAMAPLRVNLNSAKAELFFAFACAAGLVCSLYTREAYSSLATAPVYHAIMKDRERYLSSAAADPRTKIAFINSYDDALEQYVGHHYQHVSGTIKNLLQQKPGLIFFEDELKSRPGIRTLEQFYGLDSIVVKQ